jgi:D-arginine dehydrogenase
MTYFDFDILILGGGMAGASAGALLAPERKVAILERESQPGYHSTGRSAALFFESYGNAPVRALTRASRAFLLDPPAGFERKLVQPRGALFIGRPDQQEQLEELMRVPDLAANATRLSRDTVLGLCPILRQDYVGAGIYEEGCLDMDVNEIHRGFLRAFREAKGQLFSNAQIRALERVGNRWRVEIPGGTVRAETLINAAGAWVDDVATLAGVRPINIQPLRRTALTIEAPPAVSIQHWPMIIDVAEEFYFKPDAGRRLLLSPADETPSAACDIQPDELDVATAVDRFETATTVQVRKVVSQWAGLRNFVHDRAPVVGYDPRSPGFFWLAAQGGYGIQTAPALASLTRALVLGREIDEHILAQGFSIADVLPDRLESSWSAPSQKAQQ